MTMTGCGIVNDEPNKPDKNAKRDKAVADCAGNECRVRITCRSGVVHVLIGPAPVSVRTSKRVLRSTITADFAGSSSDKVIRC